MQRLPLERAAGLPGSWRRRRHLPPAPPRPPPPPTRPPAAAADPPPQVQAAIAAAQDGAGAPAGSPLQRGGSGSARLPVLAEGADVSLLYVRFRAAAEPSLKSGWRRWGPAGWLAGWLAG